MCNDTIICPGGINSQTGSVALERYTGWSIDSCKKISDVPHLLDSNLRSYLIPIWNSHQGEISMAEYVWDKIRESKIKITDVFPKRIEFWYIKRTGVTTTYHKIGSVGVAKTQCSGFLEEQGAELEECGLTTIAHQKYREGAEWDGVLVTPGQGEGEAGYEVADKETANPNNFTSFVRLISPSAPMPGMKIKSWISGVSMPSFSSSLDDTVQSFFEQMLDSISNLNDIPLPIFVFDRNATVGLLFEGKPLKSGDLLDAKELEEENISVYEDVGEMTQCYTQELESLCKMEFPMLSGADFILHREVETCLFACPPLGLYTHGYKVDAVEPVVRFFIHKLFQSWDDGNLKCTDLQTQFFEKHKDAWQEKSSEFIQFKIISST